MNELRIQERVDGDKYYIWVYEVVDGGALTFFRDSCDKDSEKKKKIVAAAKAVYKERQQFTPIWTDVEL